MKTTHKSDKNFISVIITICVQEGGIPATRLRWGPIDNLMADCRAYGIDEYIQNFMICAGSDSGEILVLAST